MGKHYVPQRHLRRFEIPANPGAVWMYDKQTSRFIEAPILSVAQTAHFYSDDVERSLANEIEGPGNHAIDALLDKRALTDEQVIDVSMYVLCMMTRGPRQRRQSTGYIPDALSSVIDKASTAIDEWKRLHPDEAQKAEARRMELLEIEKRFTERTPDHILEQIRTPFLSSELVGCLLGMTWHIIPVHPRIRFVTCDTPTHIDEGRGLANLDSELTFTISPHWALVCENRTRRPPRIRFENPDVNISKEINRRLLSHTERFVFSSHKEDWIGTVASKNDPRLSNIRWG